VTFRTKNGKIVTLQSAQFLRRFIQHVLPKGLQKIRHYGLYAGAARDALAQARALLHGADSDETRGNIERLRNWQSALKELTGRDVNVCPKCGGQVVHQPLASRARAPPEARRAA
jgi:hypothetical protein